MNTTHYNTPKVRTPAVAGSFYSASPAKLEQEINEYLKQAHTQEHRTAELRALSERRPLALIAPHAGHIYSGPIAAYAYSLLPPFKKQIKRVVLLGPVHRVAEEGIALPTANYFETPLGKIEIDQPACEQLSAFHNVKFNDAAHAQEHSLEVHLPFLQRVLDEFKLIPIAVGDIASQALAEVILTLWDESTLILVSSDLSHYHDYFTAKELDDNTCHHICEGEALTSFQQACGAIPINGLLVAAQQKHLHATLLDARSSGDTAGDKSRVVGYAAFAFFEDAK